MFKRILVPTDLSDRGNRALEIALNMAVGKDCRVVFFHVVEKIDDSEDEEFRSFYDKLIEKARRKMNAAVGRYDTGRAAVDIQIILGNRVKEIIDFTIKNGIDLIVLSSHKLEKVDAAEGWATISYKIGILAPCPVMMVK